MIICFLASSMAAMATSSTNTKASSLHSHSKSEPSSPHPLILKFNENLQRLKASEKASSPSSSPPPSSCSLLCQNLKNLQDMHGCLENMLQFPITKQALSQECCKKFIDEFLEGGSLRLLDVTSIAKEALLQTKDNISELESAIRRRRRAGELVVPIDKFLSSRKKAKKEIHKTLEDSKGHKKKDVVTFDESVSIIRNLKEAEFVTLSQLQSLLYLIYGSLQKSKHMKWSIMLSKFMKPKRVACDSGELVSNTNEFEKVDMKLQFLLCHKPCSIVSIKFLQNQLESLELCIQDLEAGIENLQSGLIRIRVSLLNIFNTKYIY